MPGTDWKEVIAPDEDKRFEYFTSVLSGIQTKHNARRALHAKGQLGAVASSRSSPTSPTTPGTGSSTKPATYRALVRYSNGARDASRTRSPTSAASR